MMTTTAEPDGFFDALEDQLLKGGERRLRRRRYAVSAGTAVVAVVAVAGLILLPAGRGGWTSPALAIERVSGVFNVRVLNENADPEQMQAELEAAGIPVRVEAAASTPSGVGRWLAGAFPDGYEVKDDGTLLQVSPGAGPVVLTVGREPESGESYEFMREAFHKGEPLHCSGVHQMAPRDADEKVRAMGYDVEWLQVANPDSKEATVDKLETPPASGVVVDGRLLRPRVLSLTATTSEGGPYVESKHAAIEYECTGEWPQDVPRPEH